MIPGREVLGHELQNPRVPGSKASSDAHELGGLVGLFSAPSVRQNKNCS